MVKILENNRWDIVFEASVNDSYLNYSIIRKASDISYFKRYDDCRSVVFDGDKGYWLNQQDFDSLEDIYCRQSRKCGIDISLGKDGN